MIKNLLLIRSFSRTEVLQHISLPLGIGYLAGFIKKYHSGLNVQCLDFAIEKKSIEETHSKLKYCPELIGISSTSFEAPFMHKTANIAKKLFPQSIITVGGPHPTAEPNNCLQNPNIDIVCRYEGEETLSQLIQQLSQNKSLPSKKLKTIKGISIRNNGSFMKTTERAGTSNLDALPFPEWPGINLHQYAKYHRWAPSFSKSYYAVLTSRGCPYSCIFCFKMFGNVFRARSIENILDEIDNIINKYNIREFEIVDDLFNGLPDRITNFCQQLIKNKIKINFSFPNGLRADFLTHQEIKLLKQAGCYFIGIPIESVNPSTQKITKKNLNINKIKENIDLLIKEKIMTNSFFIIGFPNEGKKEIQNTINFAKKSKLHYAMFWRLLIFPETTLNKKINYTSNLAMNYTNKQYNISPLSDRMLNYYYFKAWFTFYFSLSRWVRIFRAYPQKINFLLKLYQSLFRTVKLVFKILSG